MPLVNSFILNNSIFLAFAETTLPEQPKAESAQLKACCLIAISIMFSVTVLTFLNKTKSEEIKVFLQFHINSFCWRILKEMQMFECENILSSEKPYIQVGDTFSASPHLCLSVVDLEKSLFFFFSDRNTLFVSDNNKLTALWLSLCLREGSLLSALYLSQPRHGR